jgi:hypothetical protein
MAGGTSVHSLATRARVCVGAEMPCKDHSSPITLRAASHFPRCLAETSHAQTIFRPAGACSDPDEPTSATLGHRAVDRVRTYGRRRDRLVVLAH